jgi:hypothetical protein
MALLPEVHGRQEALRPRRWHHLRQALDCAIRMADAGPILHAQQIVPAARLGSVCQGRSAQTAVRQQQHLYVRWQQRLHHGQHLLDGSAPVLARRIGCPTPPDQRQGAPMPAQGQHQRHRAGLVRGRPRRGRIEQQVQASPPSLQHTREETALRPRHVQARIGQQALRAALFAALLGIPGNTSTGPAQRGVLREHHPADQRRQRFLLRTGQIRQQLAHRLVTLLHGHRTAHWFCLLAHRCLVPSGERAGGRPMSPLHKNCHVIS